MQIQLRTKGVKFLLSWSLLSRHSKEAIKAVGYIDLNAKVRFGLELLRIADVQIEESEL